MFRLRPFRIAARLLCLGFALCLSGGLVTPVAAQSGEEATVRALVETYFILNAKKDIEGVRARWSDETPNLSQKIETISNQMKTIDLTINSHTMSRVKVEGDTASLRSVAELTILDKQTKESGNNRQIDIFYLVKEAGGWKIRDYLPAEQALLKAWEATGSEAEQNNLLAQDPELIRVALFQAAIDASAQHWRTGDYTPAHKLVQIALRVAEIMEYKPAIALALTNVGAIYKGQGQYDLARTSYLRSLALATDLNDLARVQTILNNLGDLDSFQGNYTDAFAYLQQSFKINEQRKSSAKPEDRAEIDRTLALNLHNLGLVFKQQGRYDLALDYYQRVFVIDIQFRDVADRMSAVEKAGK